MFICAMDALSTLGLKDGGVWLLEQLRRELKPVDGVSEKRIAQVFAVYEEATYSVHEMSQESRKEMEDFIEEVYLLLRERFCWAKEAKNMWFSKACCGNKNPHMKSGKQYIKYRFRGEIFYTGEKVKKMDLFEACRLEAEKWKKMETLGAFRNMDQNARNNIAVTGTQCSSLYALI